MDERSVTNWEVKNSELH